MADISKEEIIHIANLACLNLSEKEIERYTSDMVEILGYAEMINSLDTENISETIGISEQKNVFRADVVKEFGSREILLQNAPTQDEGMFQIPKVINN